MFTCSVSTTTGGKPNLVHFQVVGAQLERGRAGGRNQSSYPQSRALDQTTVLPGSHWTVTRYHAQRYFSQFEHLEEADTRPEKHNKLTQEETESLDSLHRWREQRAVQSSPQRKLQARVAVLQQNPRRL